ncbi:unnamed protein product [Linum tenue]|uniref:Uncharacterized protein n=1 Tax=Linum tenue TaxID=586396 RepID=A0AAV0N464_9ROSI|nr:unnamed protein product [Linum tenue]
MGLSNHNCQPFVRKEKEERNAHFTFHVFRRANPDELPAEAPPWLHPRCDQPPHQLIESESHLESSPMLCSAPGGKPSSNWLDRLRSTKGFPTSGDVGLDDFLLTKPTADEDASDSPTSDDAAASNSLVNSNSVAEQAPEISGRNGEGDWFGVMTNVLSDLFYMGGPTGISGKKSARKQTNPKFCALPASPALRKDEKAAGARAASLNSNRNSNIVRSQRGGDCADEVDEEQDKGECRRGDGEGCGGDRELKGYSRSEVTVIDTSYEVWKFDKLVFRKRNIWKVRDKKGKSWLSAAAKKKRKKGSGGLDSEFDHGSVSGGAKKKAKVLNFHSTVVAIGGNCVWPSDDGQKSQDEEMEDVPTQVGVKLGQLPRINRHVCFGRTTLVHDSRSPRVSNKGNSSVVLIKAMPNSKKSGGNVPKNQLKERQRQQKA